MKFRALIAALLATSLLAWAQLSVADDKDQDRDRTQDQTKDKTQDKTRDKLQTRTNDRIYGYNLMTEEERLEYRNRVRTLKTAKEREQFRLEHHKKMQERAKEKGITLPDEPPARGGMMRPGSGMGPGGGVGPGR